MFSWRARRQLAAIAVVMAAAGGAALWFGVRFIPTPSCFDNRQNHGEIGIDCGGPCTPCELRNPKELSLFWVRISPAGGDLYDAVALVENRNQILASGDIRYEFTLFDELGLVARKSGTAFIYPQERLYVVEPALHTTRKPTRVEFRVTGIVWRTSQESPPIIVVEHRDYAIVGEGAKKQSTVTADLLNASSFSFRAFEVTVAVFDPAGNLIGANKVAGDDFATDSRMRIKSLWPSALSGDVGKIEIIPRVNLFNPDTIIKPQ
ncbi:MAG: hypothetical protein WAP52_03860 [Candidatus Sungiibacteriota bacterium]